VVGLNSTQHQLSKTKAIYLCLNLLSLIGNRKEVMQLEHRLPWRQKAVLRWLQALPSTSKLILLTYTITAKRQLSYLTLPSLYLLFCLLLSYLFFGWTLYFILLPVIVFAIDTLPALVLHIQYLFKNFDSTLILDRNTNRMTYRKGNTCLKYDFQDICQIIKVHSSTSPYTNGRNSFTNYFYHKFIFKDGVDIIATCLLADDLEVILSLIYNKKVETSFKLFPSV
jgi:hypothetical protein